MARKRSTKKPVGPESIVLHDSAGRVRVLIGMFGGDDQPRFQLNDEQERPRATIQVGPGGRAVISLQDASGGGLISLGVDADGETGFSITRPGNVPVLSVSWSEAEGLRLSVWGHNGCPMWQGFEPGPAVPEAQETGKAGQAGTLLDSEEPGG
jgi:hypothetical protein